MKRIMVGIIVGAIAGIIDVIPMILQNLTWDANLSAFSMWIAIGFFLSTNTLKIPGILKGLIISFLALAPCAIIIGAKEPFSLLPIGIMTVILGSICGTIIAKINK